MLSHPRRGEFRTGRVDARKHGHLGKGNNASRRRNSSPPDTESQVSIVTGTSEDEAWSSRSEAQFQSLYRARNAGQALAYD